MDLKRLQAGFVKEPNTDPELYINKSYMNPDPELLSEK